MRLAQLIARSLIAAATLCIPAAAQDAIRVATYNIKFLNTAVPPARATNIRGVVSALDADIIGLQEIADRAALEAIFPPAQWDLVIDDDSGDDQDVALAVRHPLRAGGLAQDLDADDEHFLFNGSSNNTNFPNRRDVLCVQVSVPGATDPLFVMVLHAKSRMGGRDTTDPRREGAARDLLSALEQRFDGSRYILVGDLNDNPDDKSMNILETGDPDAPGGPEEIPGPFLLNLCDSLVADNRVSWGLKASDIVGNRIDTVRPGSRDRNNNERGSGGSVSPILFDQILVPVSMGPMYVSGSARVFDDPIGVLGGSSAPSDHLPIYADFVLASEPGPVPPPTPVATGLVISALLPDPEGEDRGHEQVSLTNRGSQTISLSGWRLRDRAGNVFELTGQVGSTATFVQLLPAGSLPLNNDGDDVSLLDPSGALVHTVSYSHDQVVRGNSIEFP